MYFLYIGKYGSKIQGLLTECIWFQTDEKYFHRMSLSSLALISCGTWQKDDIKAISTDYSNWVAIIDTPKVLMKPFKVTVISRSIKYPEYLSNQVHTHVEIQDY